ncbi:putative membrane protein [Duganella sp. 1411]|uniref:SdpI family protein n=1 Tax=Duganella sp. 1411 TaxID=2806572 RepID=UPI001AE28F74|nr:SdpI family protein [Duganella sp. 1411]MBP1203968.1 putative membrane protein [Duganella sp. 1411]
MRTRYLVVCLLLIAAACAALTYYWPRLPEQVPVHWNIEGQVDGYAGRVVMWALGPGSMALFTLVGLALPVLSPQRFGMTAFLPTYYYIAGLVVCMLGYVFALVLIAATGGEVSMQRALPAGLFLLLILMGNPMGKVRRNFYVGIRTPWTLANERVWYATHRTAARLMVASGLLGLLALWMHAPAWSILLLVLAWAPLVVLYSLLHYKRLQNSQQLESH